MLFRVSKNLTVVVAQNGAKHFSTSQQRNFQVTVCGAAGGIGQPLSLLLKQNPLVTQLNLFDLAPVTPGVACDLSHINSPAKACGFKGQESLDSAIKCSDLVIIPAGVPRKPGMSRDDLFNVNASIVRDIACSIAKNAPKAIVAIVTNPVNSMVPIAAEVLKKNNCYDPARVLGVTTLDVVRSATFIGEINGSDPRCVQIPVIGGHAGTTIIPVLSQSNPKLKLTDQGKIEALTKRIQEAGTEVVQAKAGGGSATLSMAFAAARLADAVLKGLKGEKAVECAYVASNLTDAAFFANPVEFGKNGISKNLGYGKLNAYEEGLLKAAVPILQKNIKAGIDFVNK